MFLEVFGYLLFGICLGIVTGLIPGLHPNMIALFIPLFINSGDPLVVSIFVVSLGITNSIIDFIPSILFGAPEASNALSVLPGHVLMNKGFGYFAVKLTVIGALYSLIGLILLLPLIWGALGFMYEWIEKIIKLILVGVVFVAVLKESKRGYALFVFFLTGFLGTLSTKLPLSSHIVLFPLLSGLFGISMLLLQIKTGSKPKEQRIEDLDVSSKTVKKGVISGIVGGFVSGLLPGIGSSHAAMMTMVKSCEEFLISHGGITTVNIFVSFLALFLIGKIRSGLAAVMYGFDTSLYIIVLAGMFSCAVACVICLWLSKRFVKNMGFINYSLISKLIILFIIITVFALSGWYGLIVLLIASLIGVGTNLLGLKRMHMMGCLILPLLFL